MDHTHLVELHYTTESEPITTRSHAMHEGEWRSKGSFSLLRKWCCQHWRW